MGPNPAESFGPFPQLESRFWGDQRLRGHRALVGHPALAGHPALWGHPALVGHPALKVALCTLSHVRYKQEKGLSMALIWVSEKNYFTLATPETLVTPQVLVTRETL